MQKTPMYVNIAIDDSDMETPEKGCRENTDDEWFMPTKSDHTGEEKESDKKVLKKELCI